MNSQVVVITGRPAGSGKRPRSRSPAADAAIEQYGRIDVSPR